MMISSSGDDGLLEIIRAKKRCQDMGRYHVFEHSFLAHPLAPAIDNATAMVETAPNEYVGALAWIAWAASKVNKFCDDNFIKGNVASEYWLECFLWLTRYQEKIACIEMLHLERRKS